MESGAVFGFSLTELQNVDNPTTENCGITSSNPCPEDVAEDVITSPDSEARSQFGHALGTISGDSGSRFILISAPKSSRYTNQAGIVYVYKVQAE